MVAYSIGTLLMIKRLKLTHPDITHPWYADNAGASGTFARLKIYFDLLTRQGPGRGYHPEPSKIILIIRPENIEAGKLFGISHGFNV